MKNRLLNSFCAALFLFGYGLALARETPRETPKVINPTETGLRFTENKGQWCEQVKYRVGLPAGALFIEPNRLTYTFLDEEALAHQHPSDHTHDVMRGHAYYVHFEGALPSPEFSTEKAFPDYENYFLGNNPAHWASFVKSYQKISYQNLYPGIGLTFYTEGTQLKYDYLLEPGADPNQIRMRYEGLNKLRIKDGKLIIETSVNRITEEIPLAYQMINGKKKTIACNYKLSADRQTVGFHFPQGYNPKYPLIIDPVLVFCTYTGSTADNWGFTATYDPTGAFYSGGIVNNAGYPTSPGAFQVNFQQGENGINSDESLWYRSDIGLIKYTPDGTQRVWATYLGGNSNEQPHSLIVNENNELFILGTTRSNNFPVSANAFDKTLGGSIDIIVSRLSANGAALLASTYVGGSDIDGINLKTSNNTNNPLNHFYADDARGEIILDPAGNCYIASSTCSNNFPTTPGVFQPNYGGGKQDACVFKMPPDLSAMVWSSYLGGAGFDAGYSMKIDSNGGLYIVGGTTSNNSFPSTPNALNTTYQGGSTDGYVTHINANGSAILQSTFIGTNRYDQVYLIDLDENDYVYIAGQTEGPYPITNADYFVPNSGQFITKLTADLDSVKYSTRFGKGSGKADITLTAILVDICENVYISGWGGLNNYSQPGQTYGSTAGLPITSDAFQTTTDGADFYLFVLKANAEALLYATYFGGAQSQDHVDGGTSRFDKNGIVYQSVCASCGNAKNDFPVTPGAYSEVDKSSNCNNGAFKFRFDLLDAAVANYSFSVQTTQGCAPFTINFNNTSQGALGYLWDFGDGSTSNEVNPTHVYPQPGIYPVSLTALNEQKCNKSDVVSADIYVYASADAKFSAYPEACNPTVPFINETVGGTTFLWLFGDGTNSTDSLPPPHTYPAFGLYTVTLIVNPNTLCADTMVTTVDVGLVPEAAFVTESEPCHRTVKFINQSQKAQNYKWFFGNSGTSTQASPTFNFPGPGTYPVRLIANPDSPCPDTLNTTITIEPPAVAAFIADPANCLRTISPVNQSQGTDSYLWDFGDNSPGVFQANPSHTYFASGYYQVTLIANPGGGYCADTITQMVFVPNLAEANFSITSAPCELAVTLTNQSTGMAVNYLWLLGDNNTSTATNPQHTYAAAGTYAVTLIVNPDSLCPDSKTQNITILPKSIADIQVDPQLCTRNVLFTSNSQNANLYQWDLGDGAIAQGVTFSHTYMQSGTYTVKLITNVGSACADSTTKQVFIPLLPIADFSASPPTCDSTITFTNNSIDGVNYLWTFGDGANSTLTSPTHTFNNTGNFVVQLIVNPDSLCPAVQTVAVSIFPGPYANFSVFPLECTRNLNIINASIACQTYQWDFGDGFSSTDFEPQHTYALSGTYQVTLAVTGQNSCVDTLTKTVTVADLPVAAFTHLPPDCEGRVHFINQSLVANSFLWQLDDTTTSTLENPTHLYTQPGIYLVSLVVNTENLCVDNTQVAITIPPKPQAAFSYENAPCTRKVIFTADSSTNSTTYNWLFSDGSIVLEKNPTFTFDSAGVYSIRLIVNSALNCPDTLIKQILVPPIPIADFSPIVKECSDTVRFVNKSLNVNSVKWDFGDGNYSTEISPTHVYSYARRYTVTLAVNPDESCPAILSRTVNVPVPPQSNFILHHTKCDSVITVTNMSQNTRQQYWDFGDGTTTTDKNPSHTYKQPGTYLIRLVAEPSLNCPDTATATVHIPQISKATFKDSSGRCETYLHLDASQSINAQTYLWYVNDSLIATGVNPQINLPKLGMYKVKLVVNPDSICGDEITRYVRLGQETVAEFWTPLINCDSLVKFKNKSVNALTFHWNFGDGTYSNVKEPEHLFPGPGVYQVTMVADSGTLCEKKYERSVTIEAGPTADFSFTQDVCGPLLRMRNESIGANRYIWDLGDGRQLTTESPIISYPNPGKYKIRLTAIDNKGCPHSIDTLYAYDPEGTSFFEVPNVFTPNGDDQNDIWRIVAINPTCIQSIQIYDRWGTMVFSTNNYSEGWNGTFNNKPVPEGVFIYVIKFKSTEKVGTVTVIR